MNGLVNITSSRNRLFQSYISENSASLLSYMHISENMFIIYPGENQLMNEMVNEGSQVVLQ